MNAISDSIRHTPFLLGQIIDWAVALYPHQTALQWDDGSLTYQQLQDEVADCQATLIALNAKRFQRWGLYLTNSPEFIICALALWRCGCVVVPLRESLLDNHLEAAAQQVSLHAILLSSSKNSAFANKSEFVTHRFNKKINAVRLDFDKNLSNQRNQNLIDLDPALILWTSGSTGFSRSVVLQHHAVFANIRANIGALNLLDEDKTLIVLPLAHAYALIHQCLCHLAIGATICFPPTPLAPPLLCRAIDEMKISTLALVPPILHILVEGVRHTKLTCETLRLVTVGAAQTNAEVVKSFFQLLPNAKLALTYGLTEAAPRVATYFVNAENSFETSCLGEPLSNIEILLANLPNGEQEIIVRGRAMMRGYVDENFSEGEDSLLRTGDKGFYRHGRLHFSGRLGCVINRGGTMVQLAYIEDVLRQHPNINSVCVKSEKHDFWGEVPIAFVTTHETNLTVTDLQNFCTAFLTKEEMPLRFEIAIADDSKEKYLTALFQTQANK